ncbi:ATP-binding protein [Pantoea dispersa]|uniref:ATP-binding protein n=1 Tax=Pantoea dispersa TaxID=59814 RepID=UPI0039B6E69E
MHFLRWLAGWCLLTIGFVADASAPLFTEAEQAWIAMQRPIPYSFTVSWPLEYFDQHQHIGLSRDYLNYLEKRTGLRFVTTDGAVHPPKLVVNIVPDMLSAQDKQRWLFTERWLTSNALIIGANKNTNIRSLDKLRNKRVAIRSDTWYESWLQRHYPDITLVPVGHTLDLFTAVLKGEADVGLGPDIVVRPLFNRYYSHKLAVAGQIPEMSVGIMMGVDAATPELRSIINKVLAEMTAEQTQRMFERWSEGIKLGSPSPGVLFSYYFWELCLFTLLLVSLILALRRSLLLKRKAVASEARKTQFLAMMSHEIRTPMNALVASLELLKLSADAPTKQQYIELACSSSQNMLMLLNDILDHSKLSGKHMQLQVNAFALRTLIDSCCDSLRPAATRKGLWLSCEYHINDENLWIEADALRLRQVLTNLMSNAIKFTESGCITLKVALEKQHHSVAMLKIEVTDTGIGIEAGSISRLFEAWSQVDESSSRRYDGSGLGLYICRELVVLMGGTIHCVSEPGIGSTFSFNVPVSCSEAKHMAQNQEQNVPRFRRGTSILVVEDHPANQQVLISQLQLLGCEVEIAEDGHSALALLEDENYYDVILLDCNLPDRDGYSVAHAIRQREFRFSLDSTPIIAISALNDEGHKQRCLASGMTAILAKPVCLHALAAQLLNWCEPEPGEKEQQHSLPQQDSHRLKAWLTEDIDAFEKSIDVEDRKLLIYHIHRIRGVAAIYRLSELQSLAEEIEHALRGEGAVTSATYRAWREKLRAQLT